MGPRFGASCDLVWFPLCKEARIRREGIRSSSFLGEADVVQTFINAPITRKGVLRKLRRRTIGEWALLLH